MEHGSHHVDLVDENGLVVGSKPRREIDKNHDIYHVVYTVLVSPVGQVVLSRIPARKDLPNLYEGKLGVPAATIRRSGEAPMTAAKRSVERELFIDDAKVVPVGGGLFVLDDGRQTYVSVYFLVANAPETFSSTDIAELVTMAPRDLREQLDRQPDDFAPTMRLLWDRYQDRLPL
jgi:hypothetical protein